MSEQIPQDPERQEGGGVEAAIEDPGSRSAEDEQVEPQEEEPQSPSAA